jgi:hypothetical protein
MLVLASSVGCAATPSGLHDDGGDSLDAASVGGGDGSPADGRAPADGGAIDAKADGDEGSPVGTPDSGGASGDDAHGAPQDGAGAATTFVCNLVIGNSTTQQWFDDGFLAYPGIDATRWELFWVAHHYIDLWANPDDAAWSTPLDMGRACSAGATDPDRVIFVVTYAPPYPAEATYQTDLTSIVGDIQTKYPGVKSVELMTLVRAPGNSSTACSRAANNEQSIPPQEDDGIAMVAADPAFAGLVFVDPPLYVPSCSDFVADAPQYTDAGATAIAQVYGAYYAAHP